jgi:hypothetical protein
MKRRKVEVLKHIEPFLMFIEKRDTGRNIERLLAKTVLGFIARVITKMTAHLLRHLLRIDFGINVQTFEVTTVS